MVIYRQYTLMKAAARRILAKHGAGRPVHVAVRAAHTPVTIPRICCRHLQRLSSQAASRHLSVAAAAAAAEPAAAPSHQGIPQAPLSFADRPGLWDSQGRIQLKNLTYAELEEWCEFIGHDSRRAGQLWRALYQDSRWIRSMSDADSSAQPFASTFKTAVEQAGSLSGGLTLQSVSTARDGTHKLVFALDSGAEGAVGGNVETVLIPMRNRDGTQLRYTACLSSQVGCAMNCQFCYTGRMGLLGNLSTAQMVEQLVEARRWLTQYTQQQQQQQQQQQLQQLAQHDPPEPQQAAGQQVSAFSSASSSSRHSSRRSWPQPPPRINNIVFMGMGEPLHNMSALMPALDIICHSHGLGLSRAKVIVSTVGLVPQLRELRASGKAKLAVSLHATTDEVRSWIVPTNRKHPLEELIGALRELYPLPQGKTKPISSSTYIEPGGRSSSSSSSEAHTEPSNSSSSSSKRPASSDDFVVIEYVLLKDVNDTDADAHRLLELLGDVYCMINLIVFNPHEGTRFLRSQEDQVKRFRRILMEGGKVCTLRMSKGDDEMAACGQLGNPDAVSRPAPLLKPPSKLQEMLPGAAVAAEQHQQWLRQQTSVQVTAA